MKFLCLLNLRKKTLTGGRILRLKKILEKDENFMLTYGDGLSDIPINKLLKFHQKHKKIATVTAVNPPARFGALQLKIMLQKIPGKNSN